jgi:solute:Na+ symporter, SSS family
MVVRYMSIKDPAGLKYSAIYGTCWNIILGIGAVSIGLTGRILVPDLNLLPGEDPEMIYLVLSSGYFGPVLYGLLVGGFSQPSFPLPTHSCLLSPPLL